MTAVTAGKIIGRGDIVMGADETAQGEYLNLCARAHVAHDEVTIQMLMEARNVMDCRFTEQDGTILTSYIRKRPMIVSR